MGVQFLIRHEKETANPKLNASKRFNQIQTLSSPPEKKAQAGTSEQRQMLARSQVKFISSCRPKRMPSSKYLWKKKGGGGTEE